MSNSMGIASAFVLSSLFLSPFAMAEESQAFVAQNAARAAAYEEHKRRAFKPSRLKKTADLRASLQFPSTLSIGSSQ